VKLEMINALAQLIAALGVIASLFYLAAQIRQNTRSMRAIVVDSLAHSLVDLLQPMARDPESMRAFSVVVENWHGATEEARLRAVPFIFATFKLFENAWFQQRQGTLDREQWEGWDAYIRMYYHRPIGDLPPIDQIIRGEV
jgi:formyltetrahydrofolate hydrolase